MIKQLYRVLAYLIAAGVVLQAAAIAYAVFSMFEWVSAGGTIDKALIESDSPQIGGIAGFNLHQLVGVTILPLLALMFLISSFFARIPGGIRWGLIVFAATLAQSLLGIYAHENSAVGWLHGSMALILFTCALVSGIRANRALANRARANSQRERPMRHNKRWVARRRKFQSPVPSKPHSSCPLMAVLGGFRPARVKFSGFQPS